MPSTTGKTKRVFLPRMNHFATFTDRQAMKVGHPTDRLHMPPAPPAPPKLPIDWAKTYSFPINGNDIYGDCMMAAAEHGDNTFTGNNGAESSFDQSLTVTDYLKLSGGNNGLNSGQIISYWQTGLPGVPVANMMDALDIDTTDAQLVQTAIWLFGGVFFTLDIPDTWYKDFLPGTYGTRLRQPIRTMATASGGMASTRKEITTWKRGEPMDGSPRLVSRIVIQAGLLPFRGGGSIQAGRRLTAIAIPNWRQCGCRWAASNCPSGRTRQRRAAACCRAKGCFRARPYAAGDRRFTFTAQTDGNLVLYGPQGQPLWASNTGGHGNIFDAIMQTDGNLVLYNGQISRFGLRVRTANQACG